MRTTSQPSNKHGLPLLRLGNELGEVDLEGPPAATMQQSRQRHWSVKQNCSSLGLVAVVPSDAWQSNVERYLLTTRVSSSSPWAPMQRSGRECMPMLLDSDGKTQGPREEVSRHLAKIPKQKFKVTPQRSYLFGMFLKGTVGLFTENRVRTWSAK